MVDALACSADRQTDKNTHTVVTLNSEGRNVCLTQATAINSA